MCASRYKVPLQTYIFLQILLLYSMILLLCLVFCLGETGISGPFERVWDIQKSI